MWPKYTYIEDWKNFIGMVLRVFRDAAEGRWPQGRVDEGAVTRDFCYQKGSTTGKGTGMKAQHPAKGWREEPTPKVGCETSGQYQGDIKCS